MSQNQTNPTKDVVEFLNLHHDAFYAVTPYAQETCHPVPSDSRGWSQILISMLTGIKGREREKGTDLVDGSDVKAAVTWEAIDTPRFNGVIKAGTKATYAGKLESLDDMPHLYLVLWDHAPDSKNPRCRIWCVRAQHDDVFRNMCLSWYNKRDSGEIKSDNFQLHPPRGLNSDIIRNTCGNLVYPLLFSAEHTGKTYQVLSYNPEHLKTGKCVPA